jgi:hypothetical protein
VRGESTSIYAIIDGRFLRTFLQTRIGRPAEVGWPLEAVS